MTEKKQKILIQILIAAAAIAALSAWNIFYHQRTQISSDTVTMLPLARDFLSGNLLLRQWIVGTNNFFFSETIFYVLGMALGISEQAMVTVLCPVFFSAAVVLSGWFFLFREEEYPSLTTGAKTVGTVFYVLLAGIPSFALSYTLLNANSHNHLYLFAVLLILWLFAWLKTKHARWLILYGIVAFLMVFSEDFALMTIIAPAAVLAVWRLIFARYGRKAALLLLGTDAAAWLAAKAASAAVTAAGGLVTRGLPMHIVKPGRVTLLRIEGFLKAARFFFEGGNQPIFGRYLPEEARTILATVLLVLFLFGLAAALFTFWRLSDVDLLLLLIAAVNLGGCIFTNVDIHVRYLVPAFLFGGILAVKTILRILMWLKQKQKVLMIIASAACIFFLLFPCVTKVRQIPTISVYGEREKQAAAYLKEHGLTEGYGVFWASSVMNYYSGEAVDVRPILIDPYGVCRYYELVRDDWYEDDRRFIIVSGAEDEEVLPLLSEHLGAPAERTELDGYVVYQWDRDLSSSLKTYPEEWLVKDWDIYPGD